MRWRDDRQDIGFGLPAFRRSEAMNGAQDLGGALSPDAVAR
jgi:hypothetical protein